MNIYIVVVSHAKSPSKQTGFYQRATLSRARRQQAVSLCSFYRQCQLSHADIKCLLLLSSLASILKPLTVDRRSQIILASP